MAVLGASGRQPQGCPVRMCHWVWKRAPTTMNAEHVPEPHGLFGPDDGSSPDGASDGAAERHCW